MKGENLWEYQNLMVIVDVIIWFWSSSWFKRVCQLNVSPEMQSQTYMATNVSKIDEGQCLTERNVFHLEKFIALISKHLVFELH